jgi:hypothetical protein
VASIAEGAGMNGSIPMESNMSITSALSVALLLLPLAVPNDSHDGSEKVDDDDDDCEDGSSECAIV